MNATAALAAPTTRAAGSLAPLAGLGAALQVLRNLSGFAAGWSAPSLRPAGRKESAFALGDGRGAAFMVHASGKGRPVILVHGLGGSHADWQPVAAALASAFRVFTFDQRGHGTRAACEPATATLPHLAADLRLVIERCGGERPILVGHSMGALTVMQYLRDCGSANIAGVCFVDQSPRPTVDADWQLGLFGSLTRDEMGATVNRLQGDFSGTVVAELVPKVAPRLRHACDSRRWVAALVRRALAHVHVAPLLSLLRSLADCDFRSTMSVLQVPALVVLGGRSHHYGGLPLARYYRETLQGAVVRTFEASTHSPHRQEPVRFAAELEAFAAGLPG